MSVLVFRSESRAKRDRDSHGRSFTLGHLERWLSLLSRVSFVRTAHDIRDVRDDQSWPCRDGLIASRNGAQRVADYLGELWTSQQKKESGDRVDYTGIVMPMLGNYTVTECKIRSKLDISNGIRVDFVIDLKHPR